MTVLDLDRLEALADNATPGPWVFDADGEITVRAGSAMPDEEGHLPWHYRTTDMILEHDCEYDEDEDGVVSDDKIRIADAVFIAETGPDVVKELVKQLRQARVGQADAWDEGYQRGTAEHCDEFDCDITSPNPYRRNDE